MLNGHDGHGARWHRHLIKYMAALLHGNPGEQTNLCCTRDDSDREGSAQLAKKRGENLQETTSLIAFRNSKYEVTMQPIIDWDDWPTRVVQFRSHPEARNEPVSLHDGSRNTFLAQFNTDDAKCMQHCQEFVLSPPITTSDA